jgi:energy-converting hydrogenase Eha subunit H
MDTMTISLFSVFCVFIAAPAIVFGFIYFSKRSGRQVEMLKYKKEILELEVEKEELRIKALAEENRKYDRLIAGEGEEGIRPR